MPEDSRKGPSRPIVPMERGVAGVIYRHDASRLSAVEIARRGILKRINSRQVGVGDRLPAERTLAQELGVSRTTLREALDAIERAGIVRRAPGRGGGTVVTGGAKVERDPLEIAGVPAYVRRQGFTAGTRVIATSTVHADEELASALGITVGALVFEVVRVRLADGAPLSLEYARMSADVFPGLLELPLVGSIYELMHEHYGVTLTNSVEQIEIVLASPMEARVLGIPRNAPLFSVERTSYGADGTPLEASHDLFRGDRTRIIVRTDEARAHPTASRTGTHVFEVIAAGT